MEDTQHEEEMIPNLSEMLEIIGHPKKRIHQELWFSKYIDDGLAGEKLPLIAASSHITSGKEAKIIHASQSEKFFKSTLQNAQLIGMKINASKTQMLCVNVSRHSNVNTYINLNEYDQKARGEELKMLGFTFGRSPNADAHVRSLCRKSYAKMWTQRSHLPAQKLVKVYTCYIRPTIEYASAAYDGILSEEASDKIENLQKNILKQSKSYKKCLELAGIESLKLRREAAVRNFALQNQNHPRFGERWFGK